MAPGTTDCAEMTGLGCTPSGQSIDKERCSLVEQQAVLVKYIINTMLQHGICVVDKFLGLHRGNKVLAEMKLLQAGGLFSDGQVVSNIGKSEKIRGDKIAWIDGKEKDCPNIAHLITVLDIIMLQVGHYFRKANVTRICGRSKV